MFQAHHSRISRSNEGSPSSSPPMAATAAAVAASGAALNTSTDSNLDDDPNSSIINKVRSRVSSILPDALSKWFSPAKRPRETSGGSNGNEQNNNGRSGTPAGRNGNLLRKGLRQFSSSEAEDQDAEQHHHQIQQNPYGEYEEDEEDEDHAPPTRKKKRLGEGFNTSLDDFRGDLSAVPGPSGLNISAIDRRSSLPAAAQFPQYRNTFSASTPSTSPQQQQQQQQTSTAPGAVNRLQRTSLVGYSNRTTAPYNFGASTTPITEEQDQEVEQANESISATIRHRKSIREVSSRKRLNIPPMAVDRSISEPPARIFGRKFPPRQHLQQQQQQRKHQHEEEEEGSTEDLLGEEHEEENVLSNGNMNESASESSSVSNLNLSQTDGQVERNRRLSGFMGNSRSKRSRVGGSTGDLCFSSHLETEKSLFSMKNSGRPAFNASLYGSTSSLGSTNSSLFANSPFYNGRTMYGGASAYSSRRDARQKALRVPVQIRPSSSLSNFSSSNASLASDTSALSNTAKRILEIMNQCSGPLNEARKLGSSLSLNSTLASAKVPGLVQARKRFNEEDLNMSRSIRMSSPRTPYSRPLSATGIGSSSSSINKPPTTELQIPTMSQLLQMKRLQTNTESVRRMATESSGSTVLNEPTHYKLPNAEADDSNNNIKHTSKMRNKLHRIREESHSERDNKAPVPQVNLPEVQLAGLKSVPKFDIKLPTSSTAPSSKPSESATTNPLATSASTDDSVKAKKNNVYKFSSPAKLDVSATSAAVPISKAKNDFRFSDPEPIGSGKTPVASLKLGGFQFNPDMAKPKAVAPTTTSASPSTLKNPLPLKSGSCLDALKGDSVVPELKTGSCLEALAKPVTPAVGNGATSGFGNAFKLTGSNKWECDACMVRNDPEKTKCVACETPKPGSKPEAPKSSFSFGATPVVSSAPPATTTDSGFKALVAKQSAKWECSDCMTRNNTDQLKCACCEKAKPGAAAAGPAATAPAAVKSMFSMPTSSSSSDQGFKALVAQQSANKWECSACMTRNEASRSKCACCEQAKPGSTPEDAPSFSFGSKPSSSATKFSFGVPPDSDGKEGPKTTGFSFGVPASSSTNATTSSSTGFSFGSVTSTTSTTSSEDKPKFSFGSSSTMPAVVPPTSGSGFSFGTKPAAPSDTTDSPKTNEKKEPTAAETVKFSPGGFSFGSKPGASEAAKSSETVTSTTKSGFSFGSPASKTTEIAKSTGFSFGQPAAVVTPSISPPTSGTTTSVTEQNKPTVTFGSLASSATTTSSTTLTAPATSTFTFGSSVATAGIAKSEGIKSIIVGSGTFAFGSPKPAASATSITTPTTTTAASSTVESKPLAFSTSSSTGTSSVPIFGGAQKPAGPSITPSFSFGSVATGSPAAAANSSTTSSTATTTTSAFSFGSNVSKPAEASTTTTTTGTAPLASASSSFVFGQSSSQSTNKIVPTFGAAATTTSSDKPTFGTFGAAAPAATAGSTAAPAAGSSIFGSATASGSSGFSFGGTTTATAKPAESTTSAFTFGASKSNTTPVFGSPAGAAASATPIFGSPSTNTPTFGSFGSSTGNAPNSTPTFGSSAFGTASPVVGASGSIFGQTATQSAPTFGAASSSPAAPVFGAASPAFGTSNPFGSSASTATASTGDEPQTKKMFEFGSNSSVSSQAAGSTAFQFGTASRSNNNNNDNTAKPFSFSANSAPSFNFTAGSNVGQTSAPFTFGSSHPAGPVSGGIFSFGAAPGQAAPTGSGLGGMADAAPVAAPAFQFSASPMPQQNPFAATSIPVPTQQPTTRRKIRATRRIIPR